MSNYAPRSSTGDIDTQTLESYEEIFRDHFKVARNSLTASLGYDEIQDRLEDIIPESDYGNDLRLVGYALGERRKELEDRFGAILSLEPQDVEDFLPGHMYSGAENEVMDAMNSWEKVENSLDSA